VVLLDLVSILVVARNMGIGTGEIVWRVALVLAGVLFSVSVLPDAGRADRRAGGPPGQVTPRASAKRRSVGLIGW
jgi:hypothetical protein